MKALYSLKHTGGLPVTKKEKHRGINQSNFIYITLQSSLFYFLLNSSNSNNNNIIIIIIIVAIINTTTIITTTTIIIIITGPSIQLKSMCGLELVF